MVVLGRRERKKEETRESIVKCAITLFKEKGYHKTSMDEIAEAVDVSKPTLYNYFRDKGNILIAYFQSIVANYAKEIKTSLKNNQEVKARLDNLLDFKNEFFRYDIELTENYLRYRLQTLFDKDVFENPERSGLEDVVLEIVTEAQHKGEIRADIPSLVIARTFLLFTANYFLSSLTMKDPVEIDNLKNQLLQLFLDGAKP